VPLQVEPQLIRPSPLVTVPCPVLLTVSVNDGAVLRVKLAETVCAALIVTVQPPAPLHAPLQPAKL
jgi:hypothetical protein